MKYHFSIKLFLLNTPLLAFKTWWITDWSTDAAKTHAFISNIPSQMHLSPMTLWQVILIFMLFVLSTQVLVNSFTIASCVETRLVFQSYLIRTDLRNVPHFDCLILLNTFLCNFLLAFWLVTFAFMFPARADLCLYFQIKYSSF